MYKWLRCQYGGIEMFPSVLYYDPEVWGIFFLQITNLPAQIWQLNLRFKRWLKTLLISCSFDLSQSDSVLILLTLSLVLFFFCCQVLLQFFWLHGTIIIFVHNNNHNINKGGSVCSRVVSVLDSGAEGPGFKSQSRRCRVTDLGKLFTPIVPLFTKQPNR